MKTISIFGKDWPVMRELEDGWFLVAIEGGPAIGKDLGDGDGWMCILESDIGEISERVRRLAIRAYREISWPKVKADFISE